MRLRKVCHDLGGEDLKVRVDNTKAKEVAN
jgi:hypothetical protein